MAFSRYRSQSRQIFMLGPNVSANFERTRFDCTVIDSDYPTVATELHDHTDAEDKASELLSQLSRYRGKKALIFCRGPASARRVAQYLLSSHWHDRSMEGAKLGAWLAEHYHPDWILAKSLPAGIGIHHGGIPRSISQHVLRLFDEEDVDTLICTSSLIEGVNTKAEHIYIYDKEIESKNFDYFAFQNIRGRAGRFGSYLIEHVHLFQDPPAPHTFQLEIPSLAPEDEMSDDYLIGFSGFTTNESLRSRRSAIEQESGLPAKVLAKLATQRLDDIRIAAAAVREAVYEPRQEVFWEGRTNYPHLAATLELTWRQFARKAPMLSGAQAAFHAFRILAHRGNIRGYLESLTATKEGDRLQSELELGLRALRAIDYFIPDVLRDTEILVNHYCAEAGRTGVDYSTMASVVESFFLPPKVKALEEYGLPIPIGTRLSDLFEPDDTLDDAMRLIVSLSKHRFLELGVSDYEQLLVSKALA